LLVAGLPQIDCCWLSRLIAGRRAHTAPDHGGKTMKWRDARRSENVEDRRGMSVGRAGAGIGGAGLLLILLVSLLTGQNPLELLQQVGPMPDSAQVGSGGPGAPSTSASDEAADFVRAVLGDTEDTWRRIFAASGRRYVEPGLVLSPTPSSLACGYRGRRRGPVLLSRRLERCISICRSSRS
jgi:predicted metalloprotease